MIKMNIWRGFITSGEFDGAVLQYRTNNNENWKNIGDVGDGINWYNAKQLAGSPGGSGIGWGKIQDTTWKECRHTLDSLVGKTNVRFRIAYGATSLYIARDGFAFDNVWVGERTKKILIEQFTNAGDTACLTPNKDFNQLVNENNFDVIDLQYHLGYPKDDPFYLLNPVVADSRDSYYGVGQVPYAIIDGGRGFNPYYKFDFKLRNLKQDNINLAVLGDNKFEINLGSRFINDVLNINVELKALISIEQRMLFLHVAVVESEINGVVGGNGENVFKSVVMDLIPSPAGTYFDQSWDAGSTESVTLDWDTINVFDQDKIRVVAYVQDEQTLEVYQVATSNPNASAPLGDNSSESNFNPGAFKAEGETNMDITSSFIIYPNPAEQNTSIQFKTPLDQDILINIFDNTGRIVKQEKMNKKELAKNISLTGLDAGIYMVKIENNDAIIGIQRLIVGTNE
jgi:hypothetical protein